ncbi:MAG: glyoxylate carboligase [Christensenellaceae bacterium]|jgi:tartronate-semialdehyde synthase|nr:glyoxylate carboligase [Christensenellaceae bacterium]
MTVSEIIAGILIKEGITDAFGIPGAGVNALYSALNKTPRIKHYVMRHEEAAVHAADAYYRASGRMAVALCTSGPGATNFVTGIYTANIDSIPLLAISGQAVRAQLGKDAFQCVDIAAICKPIAKQTWCVTEPSEIPAIFTEAFHTARSGKPGPVLIDLPLDVQMADIDFSLNDYSPLPVQKPAPDPKLIADALDLLLAAKAPVLLMGGGVILSGAEKACLELAEALNLPVITTYMAKGGLPESHPLNAGHAGIQVGQPIGNKVLGGADLVLGLGCRFTDRHTGDTKVYAQGRKFIHVNIEPSEINKIIPADIGIVADAGLAIQAFLSEIKAKKLSRAAGEREKGLQALRVSLERRTDYDEKPIKPMRVFQAINEVFDDDTMFTTGCGLNQIWSGQFQKISKPRRYLPSGGAGTLGFDIPAAFGAMVADQKQNKAVAVMGDFGFTFLVEELAVAASNDVPLIVVILNNAYLSLIRQNQKYAYGYEYAVHMPENKAMMDYIQVAKGFGCDGERVFEPSGIAPALQRALSSKKPYIVECVCEEETDAAMGGSILAVKEFNS